MNYEYDPWTFQYIIIHDNTLYFKSPEFDGRGYFLVDSLRLGNMLHSVS